MIRLSNQSVPVPAGTFLDFYPAWLHNPLEISEIIRKKQDMSDSKSEFMTRQSMEEQTWQLRMAIKELRNNKMMDQPAFVDFQEGTTPEQQQAFYDRPRLSAEEYQIRAAPLLTELRLLQGQCAHIWFGTTKVNRGVCLV